MDEVTRSGSDQARNSSENSEIGPLQLSWGLPVEGFQISVAFVKQELGLQDPVRAVVVTRNIGDRSLSYYSGPTRFLKFVVVNESGKRVPTKNEVQNKPSFQKRIENIASNAKYLSLAPAEEREDAINLRDFFDLAPGKYTVSVVRRIPMLDDPKTESEVLSGTALLEVKGDLGQNGVREQKEQVPIKPIGSLERSAGDVAPVAPQSAKQLSALGDANQANSGTLQRESKDYASGSSTRTPPTPIAIQTPSHQQKLLYGLGILGVAMAAAICGFVLRRMHHK